MSGPSAAFDLVTIGRALSEVEAETGASGWRGDGEERRKLLARLEALAADAARVPELAAFVRQTAEEINELLAARGFSIRLDSWPPGPDRFGVAAILDVQVAWRAPGTTGHLVRGRPAFRLSVEESDLRFLAVEGRPHPLIEIPTASGDEVHLLRIERPLAGFALFEAYEDARRTVRGRSVEAFDGLVAPKIRLDVRPDVRWLEGMTVGEWFIVQAVAQLRLGMNEVGARVVSAVALAIARGMPAPPRDYVLDGPFLFALVRPGLSHPLVVACLDQDSWRDPGDLAAI